MGDLVYFLDTNALLSLQEKAFQKDFFISQKTLEEIEHIKTSNNKDNDIKYKARQCARLLDTHGNYTVILTTKELLDCLVYEYELIETPDTIILTAAMLVSKDQEKDLIFVTDDINLKVMAKNVAKLTTIGVNEYIASDSSEEYAGYKKYSLTPEELNDFYQDMNSNPMGCMYNEYLIICNENDEVIDKYRWVGMEFKKVTDATIKSVLFGDKIRPKDAYQACVIDSIKNNAITAISGRAGSGKSLLALATSMFLIEKGYYDRLVVLFNPSKVRGAADMGYYSGDAIDKAMQNSIGQILVTKFGDRYAVDMLLQQDKIKLVSMADARGMEIRDNEILYITECQNTTIDLLKLCLSRVSSGAKVIIEGDFHSQVDSFAYENLNNGMRRAIEVFKGNELFGYIELQNIWRSKIAELAEKM